MASLFAPSSARFFAVPHQPFSYLMNPQQRRRFFPIVFVISTPKGLHPKKKQAKPRKQNRILFEFSESSSCSEVVGMCKGWEGDGDPGLELELLEFMKNSGNPDKFPSKRELVEAGRGDLAEAILRVGGWMSVGWEDDDDDSEGDEFGVEGGFHQDLEFDFGTNGKYGCEGEGRSGSEFSEGNNTFSLRDSSLDASSSGRSLEMAEADETGVEGILNRLERQRSLTIALHTTKNGGVNNDSRNLDKDMQSGRTLKDVVSMFPNNGFSGSRSDVSRSSLRKDTWRTWSVHRAGFSDRDFEAAEIDFGGTTNGRTMGTCKEKIMEGTADVEEAVEWRKDSKSCVAQLDIKTRLCHLEGELSSTLGLLRSNNTATDLSETVKERLSEDLRQLSDASEFQENEIMHAQTKLRSLRAKLAILEGKMALAIIDAQKIVDEKQKRINDARAALQLLRTTCIVWPNPGSEVFLAGSFDGWATQRKMERSNTGIFSLQLKLYPGKYEIKFIVDGSWKVDPLRPIVNNGGFENNLLIIT